MKRLSAYMVAEGAKYVVLALALEMSQYRQGTLFTSFPGTEKTSLVGTSRSPTRKRAYWHVPSLTSK